ncbi:hypothetical protein AB2506_27205, partial [Klebsiella pneumoniae]
WVHVQLHQQKGMISLSPPTICNSAPFSRLDEHLRGRFRQFVFSHIQQRGIPALLVTHDEQDIPPDGRVKKLEERADV